MDVEAEKSPPRKKTRLSLSLKNKRFAAPLTETEMGKLCEGYTPQNTAKNTSWALRVFKDWESQRDGEQCPSDLFESPSAEKLNYWMSRFVVESRRSDGNPYPSSTIYQLLAGLLRHSRLKSKDCPNFLDKSDSRFSELRGACDTVARNLREKGIGAQVKHAAIFTADDEDKLWSTGTIGIHSPLALVRAVFFYIGKSLCLRGGQE